MATGPVKGGGRTGGAGGGSKSASVRSPGFSGKIQGASAVGSTNSLEGPSGLQGVEGVSPRHVKRRLDGKKRDRKEMIADIVDDAVEPIKDYPESAKQVLTFLFEQDNGILQEMLRRVMSHYE